MQGYQAITILDNLYSGAASWHLDISLGIRPTLKTATSKSTVTFVEIGFILLFDYKKKEKHSTGGDCQKQCRSVILQAKEIRCKEESKAAEAQGRKEKGLTDSTVRSMHGQEIEQIGK